MYINTTSWDSIPNWAAIVEHDPTAASHSWPSKRLEQSSSHRGLEGQLRAWTIISVLSLVTSCTIGLGFAPITRVAAISDLTKTTNLLFFVEMNVHRNVHLQNTPPKTLQPPVPSNNTSSPHQQPWLGTTNGRRHGQEVLQNRANMISITGSNIASCRVLLDHIG